MEFLAGLLGAKWKAPEIGEGGEAGSGCPERQRDECRNEFGEDGLKWACEKCRKGK
jgi:hypothetical protein